MENKPLEKFENIICSKCKTIIARQFRGKTVKRFEIQTYKKGRISNTALGFPKGYLKRGFLEIPISIECPVCKTKNSMSFVIENLLGITFSYKGEGVEILDGKKKRIPKKNTQKIYKIYVKF